VPALRMMFLDREHGSQTSSEAGQQNPAEA
jgi:hypothetical protein